MRVDEVVDDGLIGRVDLFEFDAHPDAPVAPGHTPFGVNVTLRTRHAEAYSDSGAGIERTRRANRDTAVAEIQRQCRRNRVAEAILDRNAEDHPRAAPPVEAVGEEMRRER